MNCTKDPCLWSKFTLEYTQRNDAVSTYTGVNTVQYQQGEESLELGQTSSDVGPGGTQSFFLDFR
jgi:hypothetical protein